MDNHIYDSTWKSSCSQAHNIEGAGSHLAVPAPALALASAAFSKASWDVYDHSSLFECTRCTQGQGSLNMMDGEVMQDLQYHVDEEEDTCLGMEMKMMKKRKLTNEQARQLEASFEADKKLEAEKKQRLATQLGLQPRQVAVWFQNRRARSKTKQLEIDFLALKAEYDHVVAQQRSLQAEIARLVAQLQAKSSRTKISSCSQDSTSSTNSNNGDVLSESTTLHINMESPTKDKEGLNCNTNEDIEKTKDEISRLQDLGKYTNTNSYDWESYDNELWVFD